MLTLMMARDACVPDLKMGKLIFSKRATTCKGTKVFKGTVSCEMSQFLWCASAVVAVHRVSLQPLAPRGLRGCIVQKKGVIALPIWPFGYPRIQN